MDITSGPGWFGSSPLAKAHIRVIQSQPNELRQSLEEAPLDLLGTVESRLELTRALRQVTSLRQTLDRFDARLFRISSRTVGAVSSATAASNADLGLAATTPTVLQSTEEVNATPTSFTPFGPALTGSTAQATIGGTYLGPDTGTLTFVVDAGGTHGQDDLQIRIVRPNGSDLQTLTIAKNDPINQQYILVNGLTLTLSAGTLLENDVFTLDVVGSLPTSFSPNTPAWEGSTAEVTIGGSYNGSSGSGTLTFIVESGGVHGSEDLLLRVLQPNGSDLESFTVDRNDPLDLSYTLSNGLSFTLSSGSLLTGETFSAEVSDTIGSVVDPDKPLNGIRHDNPNLQSGWVVTDGVFKLNGIDINVLASNTLNQLLAQITQSQASVTATFDAATERVILTQNTPGPTHNIVVEQDTSGFLAAVKLENAVPIPGETEADRPLQDVGAFASVQSGAIEVSGAVILIDIGTHSLRDVLALINASGAGVTASLTSVGQRVSIIVDNASQPLVLDSGPTGLFAALHIADGVYAPTQTSRRLSPALFSRQRQQIIASIQEMADQLNALLALPSSGRQALESIQQYRSAIRGAIAQSLKTQTLKPRTPFGLTFYLGENSSHLLDIYPSDRVVLASTLRSHRRATQLQQFLFGHRETASGGLIGKLTAITDQTEAQWRAQLSAKGVVIDTFV